MEPEDAKGGQEVGCRCSLSGSHPGGRTADQKTTVVVEIHAGYHLLVASKRDAQSVMRNPSIHASLLTQDADLISNNPLIARHDF